MRNKMFIAIIAVIMIIIILLGTYAFARHNNVQNISQQYVYQVNIHENLDSANPIKTNIYIPDDVTVIMKLETERYQMYCTTSYVDDINQGNHDHIMLNEITKWNYPKDLSIRVNGNEVKTFNDEQVNAEIVLSQYLKIGWNTIEFHSESDGRINASIFVQTK